MTYEWWEFPLRLLPWSLHGGISLSGSEKAEALAEDLETQFLPVTETSVRAVIDKVDVALRSYLMTPASEPKLTNPAEIQETIKCLMVSKAPGKNGIPNRALKHLAQRAVSLLVLIFTAILFTLHIGSALKL